MKNIIFKTLILFLVFIALLISTKIFGQTPTYILTMMNDQQINDRSFEFDIYLLKTGSNTLEYANNSQYFINFNPVIVNGGTLSFTIIAGTCELNIIQQIPQSKLSVDAVNSRLRIAASSPSGAGTGTIINNSGLGTRLGRFRVANTVPFPLTQAGLSWYNGPTGFFTKIFAYVAASNVEITVSANHVINLNNPPLPVILSEFRSSVKKNHITLFWITIQEINNSGFEVERTSADIIKWEKIGFVEGQGTINEEHRYSFSDNRLETGNYKYRLKQLDFNGNYFYFALNDIVEIGSPFTFNISQNYPNPSNPKSKIDYEIPFTGKVIIKVYDLIGREVTSLVNDTKASGYYSTEFDGSNLASGIYFYRIIAESSTEKFTKTLKMVLVK